MAKRILIYTNHFYPEQFKINEIVDWLSDSGHEVRVVTGIPNYPSGKFFKGYGLNSMFNSRHSKNVIVNRLPLFPRGSGNYLILLLNYFSYFISAFLFTIYLVFKKKYDFIFVHHTSPIFIAIHPIIYTFFHSKTKKYLWDLDIWPETLEAMNVINSKYVLNQILKVVEFIYSFYDKILVSSNGIKDLIKNRYNGKVDFLPNWAESNIESNTSIEEIKINIPKDKFIVMYTGNIGKAQNFDSLITTIQELKTEKIFWVFIGDGRYKDEFKLKLIEKDLMKSCHFENQIKVSQIHSVVKYADAMFLSLKKQSIFKVTIPAKLQSYMAMKKPVIAVLQGESVEIIKSSGCGIIEEDGNYIELSKKIKTLSNLSSHNLIKMGERGRLYYNKFFLRSDRKKQILNLFT